MSETLIYLFSSRFGKIFLSLTSRREYQPRERLETHIAEVLLVQKHTIVEPFK